MIRKRLLFELFFLTLIIFTSLSIPIEDPEAQDCDAVCVITDDGIPACLLNAGSPANFCIPTDTDCYETWCIREKEKQPKQPNQP